jgi:competence protein ComEC
MSQEAKYSFSVLNVGQGSLQLIEEGDRTNIVIDCNLQSAPEFVVRYFGRRKVGQIDLLILSGQDADHADADGLAFMKRHWVIKRLWYPDFEKEEETDNWKRVRDMIAELEKEGTIVETPKAGHSFGIGSLGIEVYSPHDDDCTTSNNSSIVVRVTAGEVAAIFPGDCEIARWDNILRYFGEQLSANLLLVPHHGSDDGCDEDVLEAVNPEYSVISAGEANKYGHPDTRTLKLVRKYTRKGVYITWQDGTVLFESDGRTITNVIPDAGMDEEGKKAQVKAVAAALSSRAPTYVSRVGSLATFARMAVAAVRPTVSHGGREAESDTREGD